MSWKSRISKRKLWIIILVIFAGATLGTVCKAILDPNDDNVTSAVMKSIIVAAMIYVVRRDIREMDENGED